MPFWLNRFSRKWHTASNYAEEKNTLNANLVIIGAIIVIIIFIIDDIEHESYDDKKIAM